jgi:hypothetical protein
LVQAGKRKIVTEDHVERVRIETLVQGCVIEWPDLYGAVGAKGEEPQPEPSDIDKGYYEHYEF